MRFIKDRLEARSVLNESFYKVFKNIKKYNQSYDFKPWFKTIMVNSTLDYLRKNDKIIKQAPIEDHSNISIDADAISNLSFDEMIKIIGQLPSAYQRVFNLYVIDGYKHDEIAEKLNIAVSTSKSNLSRAKEKLRAMIKYNVLV